MDCDKARELFSEYFDGALDGGAEEELRAHLETCQSCADEYAEFNNLFNEIKALPEPEAPWDLHGVIMGAVKKEKQAGKTNPGRRLFANAGSGAKNWRPFANADGGHKNWRPFAFAGGGVAACFILISLIITGAADIGDAFRNQTLAQPQAEAGTSIADAGAPFAEADIDTNAALPDAPLLKQLGSGDGILMMSAVPADTSELLAAGYYSQTFSINLTVEDLSETDAAIEALSGYAASSNADFGTDGGGSAYYSRRVDIADYARVKETLRQLGEVESESENAQKLADRIYDLEARLKAKEDECARLLALLEQSKSMAVMVAVEQQYGNANAMREDYKGQLNSLYNRASYPYLDITVTQLPPEPVMLPEKTYMQRLNETFIHSLNGFVLFMEGAAVFFTGAFIPLLIVLIIVLIVLLAFKRRKNFKNTVMLLMLFILAASSGCGSGAPETITAEPARVEDAAAEEAAASDPYYYSGNDFGTENYVYDSGEVIVSGGISAAPQDAAPYATQAPENAPYATQAPETAPQATPIPENAPQATQAPFEAPAPAADSMYATETEALEREPMPMPEAPSGGVPESSVTAESAGEKILKTGNVNLKTDTFDQTVDSLRRFTLNSGGFIESSNVYAGDYDYNGNPLRHGSLTLRVPREMFDAVLKQIEGAAVLESSSQYAEDVTAQYYDLTGRLGTKRVEEERVLEMITQAEEVEDLLALEARLGDIRTQIELFQSQINNIDRLSAFSTINVFVRETPTEELIVVSDDLGGRLQLAFIRSVNNTAVFFQNALLFIVEIFIPLLFIVFLVTVGLAVYKRKRVKKEEKEEKSSIKGE